jgi:hypothetical protein
MMEIAEENEAVIRRFYNELWNGWRLDLIDEIVSGHLCFRGSFGSTHKGRPSFGWARVWSRRRGWSAIRGISGGLLGFFLRTPIVRDAPIKASHRYLMQA